MDINQALSIVNLANAKVGFDYDDTLTQGNVQEIVKRLITAGGTTVYIVSAIDTEIGMYSLANKLGIPNHRIYATGSNEAKVAKVKELGLTKFYDNNPDVIKELPGVGILVR
jgi:soluble P-type ATPase